MRLTYAKEDNTIFVEALDQELNGYMHENLLYAEIDDALGGKMVRWESDYNNPVHFETLADAKIYIEKNHHKYTPISNGSKFKLDGEE